MSSNGVNAMEDADVSASDGDTVVTMMDVLQEQQDFENDAAAVLGASDDKNCTYSKGYIKRQAIYACLTCCPEAKEDPSKRAGVCLACSLHCHENHELIELYTKRNFRCDCGNPKFNNRRCQFTPNKNDLNYENKYNQNFSGVYCVCHRPYPDPEATEEEEMIQCIVCEDWLHEKHLEATVPDYEQYAEMICKDCMEDNDFLHDYSDLVINTADKEIIVTDPDLDVDLTSVINKTSEDTTEPTKTTNKTIDNKEDKENDIDNKDTQNSKPEDTIDQEKVEGNDNADTKNELAENTDTNTPKVTGESGKLNGEIIEEKEVEESKSENSITANNETVEKPSEENTESKPENNDADALEKMQEDKLLQDVDDPTEKKPEAEEQSNTPEEPKLDNEQASTDKPDITDKNETKDNSKPEIETNVEKSNEVLYDTEMKESSNTETESSEKEVKRKLSTDDQDNPVAKKSKVEGKPCVRPKGVKRVYKGATFWPANLRQKLCTCSECIAMYKDLAVLFLIDPDDTVSAYEALGKEIAEGPSSQYEKGLQALSSLDRVQQINALTEYNKMKDKLLDFLKSFKDRKEIVKEEDIRAFFAGMKPKREPDGVYFCR